MTTTAEGTRRASSRDKLMAAGLELVAREGIDSINSNGIARAAGVGVGTFYNHFDDKHALHRALVSRGLEVVQAALAEARQAAADRPLVEQVRGLVAAFVGTAERRPSLFRVAFSRPAHAAGGRAAGLGLSSRPLEQRLLVLQRAGQLDPSVDPRTAARAFTEMQIAAVLAWLDDPEPAPAARLIETLARMHPALACARA